MNARSVSIIGIMVVGLVAPAMSDPVRVTASTLNDSNSVWRPGSETIAYLKTDATPNLQIGGVNSDGTNERQMGAGPGAGGAYYGYAFELNWVGSSTDLVTHERMVFHEWLEFDTTQEPFTRVIMDGSDAANTRILAVPGGRGGGPLRVSRDGTTALWRDSDNFSTTYLRTAPYSTLAGGSSSTHGSRVLSLPGSPNHIARGLALSPDGSQYVVVLPSGTGGGNDLFLGSTSLDVLQAGLTQLTFTGQNDNLDNYSPDISPNGLQVMFSRGTEGIAGSFDLYLIDIDGTDLTPVTLTPGVDEGAPSWASDGLRYSYSRLDLGLPEGDNWNIYVDTLAPLVPASGRTALVLLVIVMGLALAVSVAFGYFNRNRAPDLDPG